jgi:molybdopterin molybdotransferase
MTVKDMLGRSGVVTREEALKVIAERFTPPSIASEEVSISLSLGRVTSQAITSPVDLPEFDRSTMDGYAVRSADTFGAAEGRAVYLRVVGDIPMGRLPDRGVAAGETMRIATGGALPLGADAVVMFEHTQPIDVEGVEVVKAVAPRENITLTGEDIRKGELVLMKGHVIRPQDMAALACMGILHIPVFEKPGVAIISTGNEIVPADTKPGPGQIRDSNSYSLEGLIMLAGGVPVKMGIIPDDYGRLRSALEDAVQRCNIVLFTGGSSVGTADFTANVINNMGPPGVLVHGISIKPGKPLIVGLVKRQNGNEQVPVFGLPGHQAAVAICFELFVKPVLTQLTGLVMPPALEGILPSRAVKAKLARSISSSPGREDHIRVTLEKRDDGLWARPVFGASGLISTLVKAVGTVVVPVNKTGIEAGEEVEVRLF